MPIFMDLHKASDYDVKPTVEDIKKNHIADLAVQHKYGVKFLQYWINEDAGLVFCMMEAPDKEACAAVHREAHGAMPCNVIELKGGDYKSYLSNGTAKNQFDIVERNDGSMDPGYRILLAIAILSLKDQPHGFIKNIADRYEGNIVNRPDEQHIVVFTNIHSAIECAMKLVEDAPHDMEIRIGITMGDPVTMNTEFFGDAIHHAFQLCNIAADKQIIVTHQIQQNTLPDIKNVVRTLDPVDERFMHVFLGATQTLLAEENCSIEALSKKLNMSKSRLYRHIQHLTGMSGNSFIQELRMQKSLRLIKNKYGNVAQISLEAGYNNPSYFAKAFKKRFGHSPFSALKS